MRAHLLAAVLAVGGCSLIKTSTGAHMASGTSTADPSGGASGHRASPADDEAELAPPTYPHTLLRTQLVKLVGLTPAQAKQTLASWGYTGTLSIEQAREFDPKCGDGVVCMGMLDTTDVSLEGSLTLTINRSVAISGPPAP